MGNQNESHEFHVQKLRPVCLKETAVASLCTCKPYFTQNSDEDGCLVSQPTVYRKHAYRKSSEKPKTDGLRINILEQ